MVRRPVRTFLAVAASAAVGLLSAGTASAGAQTATQTVQTAGNTQRSAGGTLAAAVSAVPGAAAAPTISATSQLTERRFVAAGTRAYVVGVEDGTFPPIGWHTTGQMGGVWAPPIKLLDGLWFSVAGSLAGSASSYTSGPGFVRLTFPVTDGVRPTLTEFSPDGLRRSSSGSPWSAGERERRHRAPDPSRPGAQPGDGGLSRGGRPRLPADQFRPPEHRLGAASGVITFNQQQTPYYAEVGVGAAPSARHRKR